MWASIVTRGIRFFLVAALLWRFGEPIRAFVEKRLTLLTWLFLIALIGGSWLSAISSSSGSRMTFAERLPLPSKLGLLAALGSAALLGGAYYFQYIVGLPPCEMCYWQRYPHMVAIVAGLAAFASFGSPRMVLVLLLVAITAVLVTSAIGFFHAGVEYRFWPGPQACSGNIPRGLSAEELKKALFGAKMVRCDETPGRWGASPWPAGTRCCRRLWPSSSPPAWPAGVKVPR